jgi:predicted ATP-dependent endonuclease of OLD family
MRFILKGFFKMYKTFKTFARFKKNLKKEKLYSLTRKRTSSENQSCRGVQVSAPTSKTDAFLNKLRSTKHMILVEGSADKIACQLALERLGLELDEESVSISECGSNSAIERICQALKSLHIPTYALIDKDPGNYHTRKVRLKLEAMLGEENVFLQKPNLEGMFGLTKKPSKAEALRFFPQWLKNNTPPKVYRDIKQKITETM